MEDWVMDRWTWWNEEEGEETEEDISILDRTVSLITVNDFQKLLRDINWLCPVLEIPTYQLRHLFSILKKYNSR